MVADVLNVDGLATLLFDLLTPAEEAVDLRTRNLRFDIALLAERLLIAGDAIADRPDTAGLPVGTFGASTGAAAALVAAAERPDSVRAVVSRGGRPDLAGDALALVRAPSLLIVGSLDREVLGMNRDARGSHELRGGDHDRAGRDAPVRGTRNARRGRPSGLRLVHPSHPCVGAQVSRLHTTVTSYPCRGGEPARSLDA